MTLQGVSLNSRRGVSVVSPSEADVMDRLEKRPRRTSVLITFGETNLKESPNHMMTLWW